MSQTTILKSVRKLPCRLTDDEIRLRGIDLADANNEHGKVDLQRKAATREFKETLDSINRRIGELKDAVRNGVEIREVEVEYSYNRYLGNVTITRTDIGEVIEQRMMTPEEAQRRFDFGEEGDNR